MLVCACICACVCVLPLQMTIRRVYKPDACLCLPTFSAAVFIVRHGAKVMENRDDDDDDDSNVANDIEPTPEVRT